MATKTLPYVRGPLRRAVLDYVRAHPGATPDAIGEGVGSALRAKDTAQGASQVCYYLHNMGLLTRQKVPGTHGTYAYMLSPKALGEEPEAVRAADDTIERLEDTKVAYERSMQQLQGRISELEKWKADAIARFPELAVDPLLLEARKIAAGQCDYDPDRVAIIDGERDDSFGVRVALAALRTKQEKD